MSQEDIDDFVEDILEEFNMFRLAWFDDEQRRNRHAGPVEEIVRRIIEAAKAEAK